MPRQRRRDQKRGEPADGHDMRPRLLRQVHQGRRQEATSVPRMQEEVAGKDQLPPVVYLKDERSDEQTMGVFLVTTRISIDPVKHDFSVNTDS